MVGPSNQPVSLFGSTIFDPVEDGQNLAGTFEWLPPAEFGVIVDAGGSPVELGNTFDASNLPAPFFQPNAASLVSGQVGVRISVVDDGTSRGVADPRSADYMIPINRAQPSSQSGNLVVNPCFEEGLNGWNSSSASTRIASINSAPCGSNYALFDSSATGTILQQFVSVRKGVRYEARASWAGIPTPIGDGQLRLRMEFRAGTGSLLGTRDSSIQASVAVLSSFEQQTQMQETILSFGCPLFPDPTTPSGLRAQLI